MDKQLTENFEKDRVEREKLSKLRSQRQEHFLHLFKTDEKIANLSIDTKHQLMRFSSLIEDGENDDIDEELEAFFYKEEYKKHIYTFEELLGYELLRDNHLVACGGLNYGINIKKQSLNEIGGLNDLVLNKECKMLELKILFNDVDNPEVSLVFVDDIIDSQTLYFEKKMIVINHMIDTFNVLLRNNEKKKVMEALKK